MLKKLSGERLFCGLDIGSQSLKACLIEYQEDRRPSILGVHEGKTSGYRDASVSDLGELSECIHAVISQLCQKTGVKLKEIQLGMGGEVAERRFNTAVIPLLDHGSKVISSRDVKKLQAQARLLAADMDESILHDFPQFYKVDDVNTAANPVGLYGRKLEVHTLLLVVNNNFLKNLVKAANRGGYDVGNVFLSSLSSAQVSINDQERRNGCVFLDLGAHNTEALFYKDGHLKDLENIPLGGEHLTERIATRLHVPMGLAEEIKKSYASALATDGQFEEEILIKKDEGYLPLKKILIREAIDPVITQLLETLTNTVKTSGLLTQLNAGIVMSGGGALLSGLPERVEKDTGLPVRLGQVDMAMKKIHQAVKFSSALGLAQGGWCKSCGAIPSLDGQGHWAYRFANKIKDLYQDYF